MAGADARSGICCQIPYGGICSIADAMHICDDDLRRWCDADRAMLDALMAADRAHRAMLLADVAWMDRAARRMMAVAAKVGRRD